MRASDRPTLWAYLGRLWRHGVNVYSGLSLLLAVAAALPLWRGERYPWWLAAVLLGVVVFVAGYRAWHAEVRKQPRAAELGIDVDDLCWLGLDLERDGTPAPSGRSRAHVRTFVHVRNPHPDAVDIEDIRVIGWGALAEILEGPGIAKLYERGSVVDTRLDDPVWSTLVHVFEQPDVARIVGHLDRERGQSGEHKLSRLLVYPVTIEARGRRDALLLDLHAPIRGLEPEAFVRALRHIKDQQCSVVIRFSLTSRAGGSCDVERAILLPVRRPWEEAIEAWRNNPDLLIEAGDLRA